MVRIAKKRQRSRLSSEQKAAFILLLFLGLGGLFLGFKSFGANIRRPFEIQFAKMASVAPEYLTIEEEEAKEMQAMKERDTDEDGLTDYDETFVYKTSPYLADTDSDGFDDKTEIFSGNDPNCPVDKDCAALVDTAQAAGNLQAVEFELPEPIIPAGLLFNTSPTANLQFDSVDEIKDYFLQLSPEELRAALLSSGMSQEQIDQIDDHTLRDILVDAMSKAESSGEIDSLFERFVGNTELPIEQ